MNIHATVAIVLLGIAAISSDKSVKTTCGILAIVAVLIPFLGL